MKTPTLIAAVLGILVLGLLVQSHRVSDELDQMRAEQRRLQVALDQTARLSASAVPDPVPIPRSRDTSADGDELAAAQARIAALESNLSEVVDSLNTAIDRLNGMAAEAQRVREPAWSAGQAVGPPDTMTAGDQHTAWAPATADGGEEWLQLGYEKAVDVAQVRVRETCGAGAVSKVVAVLDDGREAIIWQGRETAGEGIVDAPFAAPQGITARAIKVYLDTARVPGWNEIDAVELIGRDGTRQWAQSASASSSYASGGNGTLLEGLDVLRTRGVWNTQNLSGTVDVFTPAK